MTDAEWADTVRQSLFCLLEESLHSHQGVYLEPGTSLLETLQTIDAARASRTYPGLKETIAGHAHHAACYLTNTLSMFAGGSGDFDVPASWSVQTVATVQWDELRAQVASTYQEVMGRVARLPAEGLAGYLPALLGMVAHSAYHLSAIRQLKDLAHA